MLRLSQLFVRTLRDDPSDAEVPSHRLLVRAGYIRRAAPGGYTWLPLGWRVLRKVEDIVRQEMDAMGAQEVHFPALLPRDVYEATGRWTEYGDNLFRLKDRKGADFLLGPTHEEMFTLLVKDMYSSYKDLPVSLYQIQTKYRDEARPRAGLLRGREFLMKDSYSFDIDDDALAVSYAQHRDAYERIFARLRGGGGPGYIHAVTYRHHTHNMRDNGSYRTQAEVDRWKQKDRDPIERCGAWLTGEGVPRTELEKARTDAVALIASAVEAAAKAPWPVARDAFTEVQDVGAPT